MYTKNYLDKISKKQKVPNDWCYIYNNFIFIINSYTTGLSKTVLENLLYLNIPKKYKGKISSDELGLPMKDSNLILPCGDTARWESIK